MAQLAKQLGALCAKPTPSNIKWSALKSTLEALGYVCIKGSGSRRKFYHEGKDALINCHQPHPSPEVDKGCIADIVEHLRANGFLDGQL